MGGRCGKPEDYAHVPGTRKRGRLTAALVRGRKDFSPWSAFLGRITCAGRWTSFGGRSVASGSTGVSRSSSRRAAPHPLPASRARPPHSATGLPVPASCHAPRLSISGESLFVLVGRFDEGVEGLDDFGDFRFLLVIGRQLADGSQSTALRRRVAFSWGPRTPSSTQCSGYFRRRRMRSMRSSISSFLWSGARARSHAGIAAADA